ncbi:hypothetical protein PVK06_019662 [Gossypium arboreum]|uniref:Uncharacterized protein n=1 Tax=Gossypium arboreum TaxID=29729 RepID=A0ABR0PKR0_GOSAR|nr:hypothetical protein PVK06_019662 [Gossypium arboreum]
MRLEAVFLTGNHSSKEVNNGHGAKVSCSKGKWKLNKTLKGSGNRFKNSKKLGVSLTESMKRAADLIVSKHDGKYTEKESLLERFKSFYPFGHHPWMAIGDFNAILSSEDKKGAHVKGSKCQFFGEFMDKTQLLDLGF